MRYWRIINIEDTWEDLKKSLKRELYEIPNKVYKDTFEEEFIKEDRSNFPKIFQSLTTAWKGLKKMKEENQIPDIGFFDIRLVTHQDSTQGLEEIKSELIESFPYDSPSLKNAIESLFYDEKFENKTEKKIRIEAGFYLMGLTRRIFPKNEFPDLSVVLYTESSNAFTESIPYQFAGFLELPDDGKSKIVPDRGTEEDRYSWLKILEKAMIQKIESGKVSLHKINQAIIKIKNYLETNSIFDDNFRKRYGTFKKGLKDFLNSEIGLNEPGWTIGSFFIIEVKNLCIKTYADFEKSFNNIIKFTNNFNFAEEFGKFLRYSHFRPLSHHATIVFEGVSFGFKHLTDLKDKHILIAEELAEQWKNCICYGNEAVNGVDQLIEETMRNRNSLENKDLLELFTNTKRGWRFTITQIQGKIIPNLIENDGFKESLTFDINTKKDSESVKKVEFALPSRSLKNPDENILYELISVIFHSIIEHSYEKNLNVEEKKVKIEIEKEDDKSHEWVIKIEDFGKGFPIDSLKDPNFFDDVCHDLREKINIVKNWIDIQIHSNEGENSCWRNPYQKKIFEKDCKKKEKGTLFILKITENYIDQR